MATTQLGSSEPIASRVALTASITRPPMGFRLAARLTEQSPGHARHPLMSMQEGSCEIGRLTFRDRWQWMSARRRRGDFAEGSHLEEHTTKNLTPEAARSARRYGTAPSAVCHGVIAARRPGA